MTNPSVGIPLWESRKDKAKGNQFHLSKEDDLMRERPRQAKELEELQKTGIKHKNLILPEDHAEWEKPTGFSKVTGNFGKKRMESEAGKERLKMSLDG